MIKNNIHNLKNKILALVGSDSIHTTRYLNAIAPYFKQVIFITNNTSQNIIGENICTHTVDFRLLNITSSKKIAEILKQYKIELVHIQQANSYAYHTLKGIKRYGLSCKTILTTWGSDILVLPHKNILFKHLVKFNLNNVDIITSDSLYMSAKIRKLTSIAKEIHTINFGIHNFPEELCLDNKENIILSNRLHKPLYNIDKIILGFAKFIESSRENSKYKLVIAAAGGETDKLTALVSKLGITQSVLFTGMISYTKLIEYYKQARFFISIPTSDGTSLSVLEAMGYGCYPILSNIPANLEWVLNEINGSICENSMSLDQDILRAVELANKTDFARFNYEMVARKSVFNNNLQKFLALY